MKFVSDFKLVRDSYGEEIAILYIGCLTTNINQKHIVSDFTNPGSYTRRLVKSCIATFFSYKDSDVRKAIRLITAVREYRMRQQFNGVGGCVKKSLKSIMNEIPDYSEFFENQSGLVIRMYLDGMLSTQSVNVIDTQSYRDKFISMIEDELKKHDWISFSDGTMFHKTFTPEVKDGC